VGAEGGQLLLITIVGIVVAAFGAYLTIAYLAQSGEARFAGVQVTLPFGVIVMLIGIIVIVFPYTPLYEGADNPPTGSTVSSSASIPPTSNNPPTTVSKEQEESRKKRLLSVIPDQGIRSTCSKVRDDRFAGSLIVMECPSSEVTALHLGLFPNERAMYQVYNRDAEEARTERNSGSGNCDTQPGEGPWSIEGGPDLGRLFCHVNNEGRVWFEWTYDKVNVLAYAYRGDDNFQALNRWWLNF
jgi:hypothetical protein